MCGHYLHFDCYSSYKKTLEENMNRAVSNIECSCPLCRQVANCVLPIITLSATKQSSATGSSAPFSLTHSSLPNSPSKLWILSSLADKQSQLNDMMRYLFFLSLEDFTKPSVNESVIWASLYLKSVSIFIS